MVSWFHLMRDLLIPKSYEEADKLSRLLGLSFLGLAVFIAVSVSVLVAPYGRFASKKYGFFIPAKYAWIIQESFAALIPPFMIYLLKDEVHKIPRVSFILLGMFITHYIYRSFIYPVLTCKPTSAPATITSFVCAVFFCAYNGYMQSLFLLCVARYPDSWTSSPYFIIGCVCWLLGFLGNIHSDHILRNLRKPGETGYKIPRGGLFELVSAANYSSECLEWAGFALACWSVPGLAFSVSVFANLVPRARSYHKMYKEKFEDYPKDRKVVIPFIY